MYRLVSLPKHAHRNGAIYRSIDQAYTALLELNAELFCQAHGFTGAKPPPEPPGVTWAKDRAGFPGHHTDLSASRAGTAVAYAVAARGKPRTGALIAVGSARESDLGSEPQRIPTC